MNVAKVVEEWLFWMLKPEKLYGATEYKKKPSTWVKFL
jgi:hypothetical protein